MGIAPSKVHYYYYRQNIISIYLSIYPQVPLLVNLGANLEARDDSGRTPLMLTALVQPEAWGVGVARLLIEVGVAMGQRDRHGMNALHHACVYERLELVRVLLHAPDFDLAQSDKYIRAWALMLPCIAARCVVCCAVVWCGVVWCGVVWCGVMCCAVLYFTRS